MSHHFVDLLEELRRKLARMTAIVQQTVEQAVDAVVRLDARLAQDAIYADARIDEEEVRIEQAAISLLALHQPAAADLRLITTIIKVNSDFERVADCAVNVAQQVERLSALPRYEAPATLRVMGVTVVSVLRDTIRAFNLPDEELARQVLKGDDVIDALYHEIVQDMLTVMEGDSHKASMELSNIMIAKNLERIGDHCTNIAENVIYVQSGRIIRHLHGVRQG